MHNYELRMRQEAEAYYGDDLDEEALEYELGLQRQFIADFESGQGELQDCPDEYQEAYRTEQWANSQPVWRY